MPSANELRVEQKRRLFQLKKLKRATLEQLVNALDDLIVEVEAEMEEEDIAHVEKKIATLNTR
jgi:hypothetical protein